MIGRWRHDADEHRRATCTGVRRGRGRLRGPTAVPGGDVRAPRRPPRRRRRVCRVLEIGPGTGQATIPLLDLGLPGHRRRAGREARRPAGRADARAGRSTSSRRRSRTPTCPTASFDLVLSATAFHWVDPTVGIPKAFRPAAPGGWFVLVWNVFGDDPRPDPFHEALSEMLRAGRARLAPPKVPGVDRAPTGRRGRGRSAATACFEPAEVEIIRWTGTALDRRAPGAVRHLLELDRSGARAQGGAARRAGGIRRRRAVRGPGRPPVPDALVVRPASPA